MWITRIIPGSAPDGSPIISVLAKETFRYDPLTGETERLAEGRDFFENDLFWGDGNPMLDAVKHESDLIAYKPMTDVVIQGNACAPAGKRARFFDVGLRIGSAARMIRVIGERVVDCSSGKVRFSEPEPFDSMPLHFGLAYGGQDSLTDSEQVYVCPSNPVGRGFWVRPELGKLHGQALPNLEDPRNLLEPSKLLVGKFSQWTEQPQPRAWGYTCRHSSPRIAMQGLPPDQALQANLVLQQQKALTGKETGQVHLLNPQFFNGAAPGMSFPWLRGNEEIQMMYMDSEYPKISLRLPGVKPQCFLDLGLGAGQMTSVLHTLEMFPQERLFSMVWRGSCYYAGPDSLASCDTLEHWAEDVEVVSYGR